MQTRDLPLSPRLDEAKQRIVHAHGWHEIAQRPPREGWYLAAIRATPTRAPRIDIAYWNLALGWTNRYQTHWMELPANPNVMGDQPD